ncbi:catalase HPII [Candidatus Symbiopectobacterium sp. NZEC151]|uniref:catalase HPII n=2 Tax=unclassified Symbiopectobacterium TaxID=2794573 RepID=UPI002226A9FF|nr:catalase HPII [Candidatus Symbiopectobacterium sp. NZEC151]MCW2474957.1 catalase HPII [Candidatus Symbiopectobacterium sp. NZEC151]
MKGDTHHESENHKKNEPDSTASSHSNAEIAQGASLKLSGSTNPPGTAPMSPGIEKSPEISNDKLRQLEKSKDFPAGEALTTNQGIKIADNQNSLRAGERGATLLEDFMLREKITHFDHERIPERVVHARGAAAHGVFQVYKPLTHLTKAGFLQQPDSETPVFVRFSTVQGSRGSADTVRDIRGWATKFYTHEGNFDLVGNNTPVFFIQDAIKFPDLVHAVKPEPHNEIPQGQSAHDTFWDFISLQPETLHNVMWAMSDRGIPRSYRMMEGFGIHTFKMINAEGHCHFVRFHWKPLYGVASLLWDEAQLIAGRDPDFHRRELWEAIEAGDYPEYELGLQIIPMQDEHRFDFDILDPTKLIPESLVPVQRVGKMTLNRNPDNYFCETEQVAFCPANLVPGLDFSDDPLLQGRLFSYLDTQISRLGGTNFHEIPINKPLCPFHNHQRDGQHRMRLSGAANYEPNSIDNNWPRETPSAAHQGGFSTAQQPVNGEKIRQRSASFSDHYSQPRLFWLSQTDYEQTHIVDGFSFELGKVQRPWIRKRVVDQLCHIDKDLAKRVAQQVGLSLAPAQLAYPIPSAVNGLTAEPSLSIYAENAREVALDYRIKSRQVALLVADGVCGDAVASMIRCLEQQGVHARILAPRVGGITTLQGHHLEVNGSFEGNPSVLFDAAIVPTGKQAVATLMQNGAAKYFLIQSFKHLKGIGLQGDASALYSALSLPAPDEGVIVNNTSQHLVDELTAVMKKHRVWSREKVAAAIAG